MKIIHKNEATVATPALVVGTGSDDDDYSIGNVVSGNINAEAMITADSSGEFVIKFDLEESKSIAGVLIRTFDPADLSFEIRGNDTDSHTDTVNVTESLTVSGNYAWKLFSEQTLQYWFLVGTTTPEAVVYIGEVWLVSDQGTLTRFPVLSSAVEERGGEYSEMITGGGQIYTTLHHRQRRFPDLQWELLSDSELTPFIDLHNACFPNKAFWFFWEDDDPVFAYYRNPQLSLQSMGVGRYAIKLNVEEVPEPVRM